MEFLSISFAVLVFLLKLQGSLVDGEKVTLYTPNPEAIFGASYIALSPEHYLVHKAIGKVNVCNTSKIMSDSLKSLICLPYIICC